MQLSLYVLGFLATAAMGHMEMKKPYALRSKYDPDATNVDYSNTSPLSDSGSDFPCKGYHKDEWRSVANYTAGQSYGLEVAGSATHNGGSCQISLSFDGGSTFKVIKSMIGGCPLTSSYNFEIPSDVPSGQALIAWTWFNLVGNREMYMNCAQVDISSGSSGSAFADLPDMWTANIGKGCKTVESKHTVFANPGSDVVYGQGLDASSPAFPDC